MVRTVDTPAACSTMVASGKQFGRFERQTPMNSDNVPLRIASFSVFAVSIILLCSVTSASAFDLEKRVKSFSLDNGLKVLFLPRKGAPIFAARIAFKVGSVEERRGYTGAAHMLEHMLFKGTTTLGTRDWKKEKPLLEKVNRLGAERDQARKRGDKKRTDRLNTQLKNAQREHKKYVLSEVYSSLYSREGGVGLNAGTSKDLTSYIIRLPANKLELWAWIESDRLRDAVFREYYAERDVVLEERRMRYENQIEGKLYEKFLSASFLAHPYGDPIIGWESDISALPLSELERFWDSWYGPNNAVIVLVGNLDFGTVKKIITRYFGPLKARPLPERVITQEPARDGERRVAVRFEGNPSLTIGFPRPTFANPDDAVVEIIDGLLSTGRTSRLTKSLVIEKRIASSVGAYSAPGSRYPHTWAISATPLPPHTNADVEKGVWEELKRLQTTRVTEAELKKVKNNLQADFVRGLVSHYQMAHMLAWYEQVTGDWRNVVREMAAVQKVTAADVMRVAKKMFRKELSVVAEVVKK